MQRLKSKIAFSFSSCYFLMCLADSCPTLRSLEFSQGHKGNLYADSWCYFLGALSFLCTLYCIYNHCSSPNLLSIFLLQFPTNCLENTPRLKVELSFFASSPSQLQPCTAYYPMPKNSCSVYFVLFNSCVWQESRSDTNYSIMSRTRSPQIFLKFL